MPPLRGSNARWRVFSRGWRPWLDHAAPAGAQNPPPSRIEGPRVAPAGLTALDPPCKTESGRLGAGLFLPGSQFTGGIMPGLPQPKKRNGRLAPLPAVLRHCIAPGVDFRTSRVI